MTIIRSGITVLVSALLMFCAGGAYADSSTVNDIRHWSGPKYTRIVVDIDGNAEYTVNRLKAPERMFLDFSASRLKGQKATKKVNDAFVGSIRSAQYNKDTVRVVLDLGGNSGYRVFNLKNPTRVVIDIFKNDPADDVSTIMADKKSAPVVTVTPAPVVKPAPVVTATPAPATHIAKPAPPKRPTPGETVVAKAVIPKAMPPKVTPKALIPTSPVVGALKKPPVVRAKPPVRKKLNIRRVVIDPGHGGKDPGAMANGLQEKHLVLDIAKRVKRELEKKGGYEVILTRSTDKFLQLEERAMVANNKSADIFVSIHINASKNTRVSGLETYILNLSTSEKSLEVAARENMVSEREMRKKRDELGVILASMSMNRDTRKSGVLAGKVQKSMVNNLSKYYSGINDHKDRGAMFYVLYRAQMPSVLVEVSYLTNKTEAVRLNGSLYRSRAAHSIAEGIDQYFKVEPDVLKVAMR